MKRITIFFCLSVLLFSCRNEETIDAAAVEVLPEDSVSVEEKIRKDTLSMSCSGASLLGAWVSADDPNEVIMFTADSMISTYKGSEDATSAATYHLFDSLNSKTGTRSCFLYANSGELGEMEYEVLDVSHTGLSMVYLTRGNTLRYNRVK